MSLLSILTEALSIKENLSPQSKSQDKLDLIKKIESDFNVKFVGAATIYSVLIKIIRLNTNTLAIAQTIIPLWKELVPFLFKQSSYSTTEIYFGKIRSCFDDHPDPDVREYIFTSIQTTKEHKRQASNRANQRCLERMKTPLLIDMDDFIDNIKRDIKSQEFAPLMVALQSACGSRNIELLNHKVATFTKSSIDGYITQTGQAKSVKKGIDSDQIVKPVIGVDVGLFLERLEYARTFTNEKVESGATNAKLADFFQNRIVRHTKKLYPQMPSGSASHRLRGAYVKVSYRIHNKDKEISPMAWAKRVLGHNALNSVAYYDSVLVVGQTDVRIAELEKQLDDALGEVSILKARIENKRKRISTDSEDEMDDNTEN